VWAIFGVIVIAILVVLSIGVGWGLTGLEGIEGLVLAVIAAGVVFVAGFSTGAATGESIEIENAKSKRKRAENKLRRIQELSASKIQEISGLLQTINKQSVLLPSLVRWSDAITESYDNAISEALKNKKHPAPKAAEQVKLARHEARTAKRELMIARNRIDLYESLAPWLTEYTEYTVGELIDALRDDEEAVAASERGEDPARRYIPKAEWRRLTEPERNQLALDRYCDTNRKRSPWSAGIEYERYVGYVYECEGYSVEYCGALRGREDLGIDLICKSDDSVDIVQCKRLAVEKGIPVRENVIAQIFGSAEFYRMSTDTPKTVKPVLITSFELSDEARRFASHLNVEVKERFSIQRYPMIKCNISALLVTLWVTATPETA